MKGCEVVHGIARGDRRVYDLTWGLHGFMGGFGW